MATANIDIDQVTELSDKITFEKEKIEEYCDLLCSISDELMIEFNDSLNELNNLLEQCESSKGLINDKIKNQQKILIELEATLKTTPPKIIKRSTDKKGNVIEIEEDNPVYIELCNRIAMEQSKLTKYYCLIEQINDKKNKMQTNLEFLKVQIDKVNEVLESLISNRNKYSEMSEHCVNRLSKITSILDEYLNIKIEISPLNRVSMRTVDKAKYLSDNAFRKLNEYRKKNQTAFGDKITEEERDLIGKELEARKNYERVKKEYDKSKNERETLLIGIKEENWKNLSFKEKNEISKKIEKYCELTGNDIDSLFKTTLTFDTEESAEKNKEVFKSFIKNRNNDVRMMYHIAEDSNYKERIELNNQDSEFRIGKKTAKILKNVGKVVDISLKNIYISKTNDEVVGKLIGACGKFFVYSAYNTVMNSGRMMENLNYNYVNFMKEAMYTKIDEDARKFNLEENQRTISEEEIRAYKDEWRRIDLIKNVDAKVNEIVKMQEEFIFDGRPAKDRLKEYLSEQHIDFNQMHKHIDKELKDDPTFERLNYCYLKEKATNKKFTDYDYYTDLCNYLDKSNTITRKDDRQTYFSFIKEEFIDTGLELTTSDIIDGIPISERGNCKVAIKRIGSILKNKYNINIEEEKIKAEFSTTIKDAFDKSGLKGISKDFISEALDEVLDKLLK